MVLAMKYIFFSSCNPVLRWFIKGRDREHGEGGGAIRGGRQEPARARGGREPGRGRAARHRDQDGRVQGAAAAG